MTQIKLSKLNLNLPSGGHGSTTPDGEIASMDGAGSVDVKASDDGEAREMTSMDGVGSVDGEASGDGKAREMASINGSVDGEASGDDKAGEMASVDGEGSVDGDAVHVGEGKAGEMASMDGEGSVHGQAAGGDGKTSSRGGRRKGTTGWVDIAD